jgi:hypothetical protein
MSRYRTAATQTKHRSLFGSLVGCRTNTLLDVKFVDKGLFSQESYIDNQDDSDYDRGKRPRGILRIYRWIQSEQIPQNATVWADQKQGPGSVQTENLNIMDVVVRH